METSKMNVAEYVFEGREIRVQIENGQPWFNANDICQSLGFANPHKAVGDHVDTDGLTKREAIDAIGRLIELLCAMKG